jgi:hypothetical protein
VEGQLKDKVVTQKALIRLIKRQRYQEEEKKIKKRIKHRIKRKKLRKRTLNKESNPLLRNRWRNT